MTLEVDQGMKESYAEALLVSLWPKRLWSTNVHLQDTPRRFVKMLQDLTTPCDINWKTFPSGSDEMVVVKDIPFASLCAHHLVPFTGLAHVAYIPNNVICGLSKLARVVRHYSAGLQVQEELTQQIANNLNLRLASPVGVAVVMEAEHMCMTLRGVQVPGTKTITSCMLGAFGDHSKQARSEFLNLIGRNH